jgi:transcriptional regulator with GAF, ATPase, and Fis domain
MVGADATLSVWDNTGPMEPRILAIAKSLLTAGEVEPMLTAALDGLIELAAAQRGLILLFSSAGETKQAVARDDRGGDLAQPEFEFSSSIIEQVRRSRRGVRRANALEDGTVGKRQSVLRLGILSVLSLPILGSEEGDPIGAVYLDHRRQPGRFSAETEELAQSFVDLISLAVEHLAERRRLKERVEVLDRELRRQYRFEGIIGCDPSLVDALQRVAQVAPAEVSLLIEGESGTGKELIARAVHANSPRRRGPFVPVNCGALPETLLDAELFGHVRGAFTGAVGDRAGWFERARGGTLFLDEVGEMSPALQVKLLRVLETGDYARVGSSAVQRADVRVVAATHRSLEEMVQAGTFRGDLLYRLKVVEVRVPALRQRRSDILLLARHFLRRQAPGGEAKRLSPEAEAALTSYDFPGNVRELSNLMQRAALLSHGPTIAVEDLPASVRERKAVPRSGDWQGLNFPEAKRRAVEQFERTYLVDRLRASRGNISRAARASGIDVKNFHVKMTRLGIDPRRFKEA